jgi:hypothetical protein
MIRIRLSTVALAALLSTGFLVTLAPQPVAAACHYGAFTTSSKTGTAYANKVTATVKVHWRYQYDCSWDIVGIHIDWRQIYFRVNAPDDWFPGAPGRDLTSIHVRNLNAHQATGTLNFAQCFHADCSFGPVTVFQNVYLDYSPQTWDPNRSPYTHSVCDSCVPSGFGDLFIQYGFVHNVMRINTVAWGCSC